MFFYKFKELCKINNKAMSVVADEIGISRSTITHWKKNGFQPSKKTLMKIAEYFNVSTDYLLDNENAEDEVNEYLEELRNRSEMRMLFSVAKGATKEEIEQAVKIIEALRKND